VGPTAYVSNASDLHPINPTNHLLKYSDDTYLIVPSVNSRSLQHELMHVAQWVIQYNLKLNTNTSLEMIVHSEHLKFKNSSPCIPEVSRVRSMSILGVQFNQISSFGSHVQAVVGKAARYARKTQSINPKTISSNTRMMIRAGPGRAGPEIQKR